MKNVIKKAFSLLLVSVVAVSMFSFITPNRVDAKVELSKDYVYVFFKELDQGIKKPGYYTIKFFYPNGKLITEIRRTIEYDNGEHKQKEKIYLPFWTAKIKFEAVTPKMKGKKQTKATFTAIPNVPRSNVRPERKILSIGIISNRIGIMVNKNDIKPREVCAIFDYISEIL